ncbi:hypothetical protein [Cryobacterium sp. TMS1-13-1]|uniref:hypothetical protein n=1 Tax=Cryobacterium sp. TMS1-13-1 TaxID=1259220 RepID=UPI00106972B3|nr:hypothetical protein [Cryobacterium sp. TMS1-13-1]TFD20175.1 hypothetical protein E3T31_14735 [Cryobacterium sp. TMS1-13-1]
MRFECANPDCNELVWLIRAKSRQANKKRVATGLPLRLSVPPAPAPQIAPTPLTLVPPLAGAESAPRQQRSARSHLRVVPPLQG